MKPRRGGLALALAAALAGCTTIAADQRSFEGTRWRVTAINGAETPASGDYRLEFGGGAVRARLGCNMLNGGYAVTGDLVSVRDLASTRMACAEPAASFEAQGLAIFGTPMWMRWSSDRRLALVNAAGSMVLERLP